MEIEVQNEFNIDIPVSEEDIISWTKHTLETLNKSGDICLCIMDEATIAHLNGEYRKQQKPTNVLSFPSALPDEIQAELNMLGDVLICPMVLVEEAKQLNKPLRDHWAHICVHGVLHLLGYDHINNKDAQIMQAEEIKILADFDIPNPYSESEGAHFEH